MKYEYKHEKLIKYQRQAEKVYSENSFRFSKDYLLEKFANIELLDEHKEGLIVFIDYLQTDEDLKRYIWTFYYTLFLTQEEFYKELYGNGLCTLKMPDAVQEKFPGYCYSILMLIAEDNLIEFLAQSNYDKQTIESIVKFYWFKFKEFSEIDFINYKSYGLRALWPHLYTYAKPTAFRLGRLVYQVATFKDFCEVYEYNGDRKIIALPTCKYDNVGYCSKNGVFEPIYDVKDNFLYANEFDLNGILKQQLVKLDLSKYEKILSPYDNVLTIHIPGDGKLLDENVQKSLSMAKDAINGIFKKYDIKGIVCYTWLLYTQLKDVLKEKSNILQFQENFDIALHDDDTVHSLCNHVFNVKDDADFEKLVPNNSFQTAMLERVKSGKKIYLGYGILK